MADPPRRLQGIKACCPLIPFGYSQFKAGVRFINCKALQRCLIEIIQHLADNAVILDANAVKFTARNRRVDKARHVVLARLQIEKGRFAARIGKFGHRGEQRPIEFDRLARQAGQGCYSDRRTRRHGRAA